MPTDDANDDDCEPTIHVRVITLLELLEFMGDLGPSPGVTLGSREVSSERRPRRRRSTGLSLADAVASSSLTDLFGSPPPGVEDAVIKLLLRRAAQRRERPSPDSPPPR